MHIDGVADAVVGQQGDGIAVQRKVYGPPDVAGKGDLLETRLEDEDLAGAAVLRARDGKVEDAGITGKRDFRIGGSREINDDIIAGEPHIGKLLKAEGLEHVKVQGLVFGARPDIKRVSDLKKAVSVRTVRMGGFQIVQGVITAQYDEIKALTLVAVTAFQGGYRNGDRTLDAVQELHAGKGTDTVKSFGGRNVLNLDGGLFQIRTNQGGKVAQVFIG